MHQMNNRQSGMLQQAFISPNLWCYKNAVSANTFNDGSKNCRYVANQSNGFVSSEECDQVIEEAEPLQFCNLKENILRLEELAKKNGISLEDDRMDNRQYLFQELCDVNPNADMFERTDSLGPTCWFDPDRRFSGLRPEHLLDEHILAELVYQFGLEHMRELPELPTETINRCLLAV